MKVSIITASFNSSSWLTTTYKSICSQTHKNWEWVITDDCSTDNSYDLLLDIAKKDPRVILSRNLKNSGAAVTRNVSLSRCSGQFIAFLDSDDVWLPNKLEMQIKFMGNEIDFSFTAYELIDEKGKSLNSSVDLKSTGFFSYEDMLRKKATIGCSTVVLRRSAFDDISMPLIRTGQDYALWLKLLKSGQRAYILPNILTKYRISPNSISRNKLKKAIRQWEIYRKIEGLPLRFSMECFIFYAFRAIFRN